MPRRFFEVKSMKTISIDIETFSDVNLAKCGVYKYAESPAFEILLNIPDRLSFAPGVLDFFLHPVRDGIAKYP